MAEIRRIRERKKQKTYHLYDYNLLVSIVLLTCFGLIMLYSTSAYSAQVKFKNDMYYFEKQAIISAVCFIAMIIF